MRACRLVIAFLTLECAVICWRYLKGALKLALSVRIVFAAVVLGIVTIHCQYRPITVGTDHGSTAIASTDGEPCVTVAGEDGAKLGLVVVGVINGSLSKVNEPDSATTVPACHVDHAERPFEFTSVHLEVAAELIDLDCVKLT